MGMDPGHPSAIPGYLAAEYPSIVIVIAIAIANVIANWHPGRMSLVCRERPLKPIRDPNS